MKSNQNNREQTISRVTLWGAGVNVLLACIKLLAGIIGRSGAMVADAVHSFSDLISDVIVLVMVRIAGKGEDKNHDYGHGKFETLATTFVALLLLVVGGKMMAEGVEKILLVMEGGTLEAPTQLALWAAVLSIMAKEALYQWTARVGKRVNSPAMVTNAWHHRSDALSSVGAAVGIGAAIILGGQWTVLDPLVACVISILIMVVAVKMALPALSELTEASLPEQMEEQILTTMRQVEGVDDVHGLRTRRNGPNIIIEAHLVVNPEMTVFDAHAITEKVEEQLRLTYGQETHIALHVEPSIESK